MDQFGVGGKTAARKSHDRIIPDDEVIHGVVALIVQESAAVIGDVVLQNDDGGLCILVIKGSEAACLAALHKIISYGAGTQAAAVGIDAAAVPVLCLARNPGAQFQITVHIHDGVVLGGNILA